MGKKYWARSARETCVSASGVRISLSLSLCLLLLLFWKWLNRRANPSGTFEFLSPLHLAVHARQREREREGKVSDDKSPFVCESLCRRGLSIFREISSSGGGPGYGFSFLNLRSEFVISIRASARSPCFPELSARTLPFYALFFCERGWRRNCFRAAAAADTFAAGIIRPCSSDG